MEPWPSGFVAAGFSLGCVMAVHVATQRTVSGVLMIAGAIPASAFGDPLSLRAGPAESARSAGAEGRRFRGPGQACLGHDRPH
jgi:predicted alpha/beta hydrolase family esterase